MLPLQTLGLEKEKFNLSLPTELMAEFAKLVGPKESKKKWLLFSVAVLALLDMPDAARRTIMSQVASVEIGMMTFDELLAKTKAGRLRIEAEQHLPNQGRPRKP